MTDTDSRPTYALNLRDLKAQMLRQVAMRTATQLSPPHLTTASWPAAFCTGGMGLARWTDAGSSGSIRGAVATLIARVGPP
jgi:hypothetical protein